MTHARDITIHTVWSSEAVTGSAGVTSQAYDLGNAADNFTLSLQVEVANTGASYSFDYTLSNNGTDFLLPTGSSYGGSIVAGFTGTSGPNSNGKDIFAITPALGRYIKVHANEVGASPGYVSAWLALQ